MASLKFYPVFFNHIAPSVEASDLRALCSRIGKVTDVIIVDRYGFVNMATGDEAMAVIHELNGRGLDSNLLHVDYSEEMKEVMLQMGISFRCTPDPYTGAVGERHPMYPTAPGLESPFVTDTHYDDDLDMRNRERNLLDSRDYVDDRLRMINEELERMKRSEDRRPSYDEPVYDDMVGERISYRPPPDPILPPTSWEGGMMPSSSGQHPGHRHRSPHQDHRSRSPHARDRRERSPDRRRHRSKSKSRTRRSPSASSSRRDRDREKRPISVKREPRSRSPSSSGHVSRSDKIRSRDDRERSSRDDRDRSSRGDRGKSRTDKDRPREIKREPRSRTPPLRSRRSRSSRDERDKSRDNRRSPSSAHEPTRRPSSVWAMLAAESGYTNDSADPPQRKVCLVGADDEPLQRRDVSVRSDGGSVPQITVNVGNGGRSSVYSRLGGRVPDEEPAPMVRIVTQEKDCGADERVIRMEKRNNDLPKPPGDKVPNMFDQSADILGPPHDAQQRQDTVKQVPLEDHRQEHAVFNGNEITDRVRVRLSGISRPMLRIFTPDMMENLFLRYGRSVTLSDMVASMEETPTYCCCIGMETTEKLLAKCYKDFNGLLLGSSFIQLQVIAGNVPEREVQTSSHQLVKHRSLLSMAKESTTFCLVCWLDQRKPWNEVSLAMKQHGLVVIPGMIPLSWGQEDGARLIQVTGTLTNLLAACGWSALGDDTGGNAAGQNSLPPLMLRSLTLPQEERGRSGGSWRQASIINRLLLAALRLLRPRSRFNQLVHYVVLGNHSNKSFMFNSVSVMSQVEACCDDGLCKRLYDFDGDKASMSICLLGNKASVIEVGQQLRHKFPGLSVTVGSGDFDSQLPPLGHVENYDMPEKEAGKPLLTKQTLPPKHPESAAEHYFAVKGPALLFHQRITDIYAMFNKFGKVEGVTESNGSYFVKMTVTPSGANDACRLLEESHAGKFTVDVISKTTYTASLPESSVFRLNCYGLDPALTVSEMTEMLQPYGKLEKRYVDPSHKNGYLLDVRTVGPKILQACADLSGRNFNRPGKLVLELNAKFNGNSAELMAAFRERMGQGSQINKPDQMPASIAGTPQGQETSSVFSSSPPRKRFGPAAEKRDADIKEESPRALSEFLRQDISDNRGASSTDTFSTGTRNMFDLSAIKSEPGVQPFLRRSPTNSAADRALKPASTSAASEANVWPVYRRDPAANANAFGMPYHAAQSEIKSSTEYKPSSLTLSEELEMLGSRRSRLSPAPGEVTLSSSRRPENPFNQQLARGVSASQRPSPANISEELNFYTRRDPEPPKPQQSWFTEPPAPRNQVAEEPVPVAEDEGPKEIRRLRIINISKQANELELKEILNHYGQITRIDLKLGIAFVQIYASALMAVKCVAELNGFEFKGTSMKVQFNRGSYEDTKDFRNEWADAHDKYSSEENRRKVHAKFSNIVPKAPPLRIGEGQKVAAMDVGNRPDSQPFQSNVFNDISGKDMAKFPAMDSMRHPQTPQATSMLGQTSTYGGQNNPSPSGRLSQVQAGIERPKPVPTPVPAPVPAPTPVPAPVPAPVPPPALSGSKGKIAPTVPSVYTGITSMSAAGRLTMPTPVSASAGSSSATPPDAKPPAGVQFSGRQSKTSEPSSNSGSKSSGSRDSRSTASSKDKNDIVVLSETKPSLEKPKPKSTPEYDPDYLDNYKGKIHSIQSKAILIETGPEVNRKEKWLAKVVPGQMYVNGRYCLGVVMKSNLYHTWPFSIKDFIQIGKDVGVDLKRLTQKEMHDSKDRDRSVKWSAPLVWRPGCRPDESEIVITSKNLEAQITHGTVVWLFPTWGVVKIPTGNTVIFKKDNFFWETAPLSSQPDLTLDQVDLEVGDCVAIQMKKMDEDKDVYVKSIPAKELATQKKEFTHVGKMVWKVGAEVDPWVYYTWKNRKMEKVQCLITSSTLNRPLPGEKESELMMMSGVVQEVQIPAGGIIILDHQSLVALSVNPATADPSMSKVYFHRSRVHINGSKLLSDQSLEESLLPGDQVSVDLLRNHGNRSYPPFVKSDAHWVALAVRANTVVRGVHIANKLRTEASLGCESGVCRGRIVYLSPPVNQGNPIVKGYAVVDSGQYMGQRVELERKVCIAYSYSLAKADLSFIFNKGDVVYLKLFPYNSFSVEKLWLGFHSGNLEGGSLDQQQKDLAEQELSKRGLTLSDLDSIVKGQYPSRNFIPLPTQAKTGSVISLKEVEERAVKANVQAANGKVFTIDRSVFYIFGSWMGNGDLAYCLEKGGEVNFELPPKYAGEDPEAACLAWIGSRPHYSGTEMQPEPTEDDKDDLTLWLVKKAMDKTFFKKMVAGQLPPKVKKPTAVDLDPDVIAQAAALQQLKSQIGSDQIQTLLQGLLGKDASSVASLLTSQIPTPGQPPFSSAGQPPLPGIAPPPLPGVPPPPLPGAGLPPLPVVGQPPLPGAVQPQFPYSVAGQPPPLPGTVAPPFSASGQPTRFPAMSQPSLPGNAGFAMSVAAQSPWMGQQPPLPGGVQPPPLPRQPPLPDGAGIRPPRFPGVGHPQMPNAGQPALPMAGQPAFGGRPPFRGAGQPPPPPPMAPGPSTTASDVPTSSMSGYTEGQNSGQDQQYGMEQYGDDESYLYGSEDQGYGDPEADYQEQGQYDDYYAYPDSGYSTQYNTAGGGMMGGFNGGQPSSGDGTGAAGQSQNNSIFPAYATGQMQQGKK